MDYKIERVTIKRESLGNYHYKIYEGSKLIATYWHDFRGDGCGIKFQNGLKESNPLGGLSNFLTGGGPEPLELTSRAIEYLKERNS